MADPPTKSVPQLSALASITSTDFLVDYPVGGPLKRTTVGALSSFLTTGLLKIDGSNVSMTTGQATTFRTAIGAGALAGPLLTGIKVGDATYTGINSTLFVSENIDNTRTGYDHGYSDVSVITRSSGGPIGYSSFATIASWVGTNNYDHFAGFEDLATFSFTGNMVNHYGFFYQPVLNHVGTLTNAFGFYAANPPGTGTITRKYGVYIESQTGATSLNYNIYSEGAASFNYFGGKTGMGLSSGAPTHTLDILADATNKPGLVVGGGSSVGTASAGSGQIVLGAVSPSGNLSVSHEAGANTSHIDSSGILAVTAPADISVTAAATMTLTAATALAVKSSTTVTITPFNYIASETGANNALVVVSVPTLVAGLQMKILLAHTLQAGANTISYNGAVKNLKSSRNPANNIATVYAVGGILECTYDGTQFQDCSQ